MKIERKSEGKHAVVLSLAGTIQGGPDAEHLQTAIRDLVAEGRPHVLLDLQGVTWISSTGLGILIGGHTSLRRAGGSLKIVNLTERVESLFAVTKLNLVFEVYSDEVTALRSFRPATDRTETGAGAGSGP